MGAWATYVISCSTEAIGLNNFLRDVIGPLQCDALGGQTMPAKNGGQSELPGLLVFCLIFTSLIFQQTFKLIAMR